MNYLKLLLAAAALWYFFNPPMPSHERYKRDFISSQKQNERALSQISGGIIYDFDCFCSIKVNNLSVYGMIVEANKKAFLYKSMIRYCPNNDCFLMIWAEYKKFVNKILLDYAIKRPYQRESVEQLLKRYFDELYLFENLVEFKDLDYSKLIVFYQIELINIKLLEFLWENSPCDRGIYSRMDVSIAESPYGRNLAYYTLGDTIIQELAFFQYAYSKKLMYFNNIKSVKINGISYPFDQYIEHYYFKYKTRPKQIGKHAYTVEFAIDTTYGIREDTVRRTFYYYVYKQPVELVTKATFTAKTGARLQLKNGFTGGEIALDSLTQNADIQYFFPQVDSFATPKNLVIEYPDLDNNLQRATSTDGKIPASVLATLAQRKRVSAVNIFSQRPSPSSLALILKP